MTSLEPTLSKIPDEWKPPRRRSRVLASQQKSFLFLLEEKIRRAQIKKCE